MSAVLRASLFLTLIGAIALPFGLLAGMGGAHDRAANLSDIERVRRVLTDQPELVLQAIQILQTREANAPSPAQAQSPGDKSARLVQSHAAALFDDPMAPVIGNPAGDVTIVEFFDYRCPYCKQAHATVNALLAEDPGIRLVHKHLPILGPDSVVAARAALAARRQAPYARYHDALMQSRGAFTEDSVVKAAVSLGMDGDRLMADMKDDRLLVALRGNVTLAQALDIRGTPSYVVGNAIYFGAPDAATLRQLVAEARKKT
ncbi:MAG: DsbA family protein [Alphaproteobacteria bacterium]